MKPMKFFSSAQDIMNLIAAVSTDNSLTLLEYALYYYAFVLSNDAAKYHHFI